MKFNNLEVHRRYASVNIYKSYVQGEKKTFFLYCHGSKEVKNIIILVHGISRNYKEMLLAFSSCCDENTLMIAPHFSADYCSDYQRLGRKNKGPRVDYILKSMVNKMKEKLGFDTQKINLFGFSAGAQFAHRYAYAHPEDIEKVALVSAGWYTLPTYNEAYPLGLALADEFADIKFEIARILPIKFKLYVGADDDQRDKALNKNKKVDVTLGENRIERAANWKNSMNERFNKYHINNHIDLIKLNNVGYSFDEAVSKTTIVENVMNWFNEVK